MYKFKVYSFNLQTNCSTLNKFADPILRIFTRIKNAAPQKKGTAFFLYERIGNYAGKAKKAAANAKIA